MDSRRRIALCLVILPVATAAGAATTSLYHPYVNEREREIEYEASWRGVGDDVLSLQRASFGYSWTDRLATEIYLISETPGAGGRRERTYEFEARWQLTEQGEYASDWGLLFEVEAGNGTDRNEAAFGLLWEKELGRAWVATANAMLEYEFGGDVGDEFETAFRGQLRYRHRPALEPALELHLDDRDYAAGPALQGIWRSSPGKQVRWGVGVFFGIGHDTPATSVRTNLEVEF